MPRVSYLTASFSFLPWASSHFLLAQIPPATPQCLALHLRPSEMCSQTLRPYHPVPLMYTVVQQKNQAAWSPETISMSVLTLYRSMESLAPSLQLPDASFFPGPLLGLHSPVHSAWAPQLVRVMELCPHQALRSSYWHVPFCPPAGCKLPDDRGAISCPQCLVQSIPPSACPRKYSANTGP